MFGGKMKSMIALILALFVVTSFQNCSADNFATEGNGQPYEGLTPDVVIRDDSDIEEPGEPPGGGTDMSRRSNEEPSGDQAILICSKPTSIHFDRIIFGYLASGDAVISFKQKNGVIFHIPWDSSQRIHPANTVLAKGYVLKRAIENLSFDVNGKLHLMIRDDQDEKANETFICE